MQLQITEEKKVQAPPYLNEFWKSFYSALLQNDSTEITPVVFFADHGVSNSIYATSTVNYTSNFAIQASDNSFHSNQNLITADIATGRYFQELGNVLNLKIASSTHNFIEQDALEPKRLTDSINKGASIIELIKTPIIYLKGVGANNEIAAECLLKSIWNLKSDLSLFNSKSKDLNKVFESLKPASEHPFSHLEKFGGYETAAFLGLIFAAIERGKFILIDGESALAAMAICLKMYPTTKRFFQIVYHSESSVFAEFCENHNLKALFTINEPTPNLFYLEPTIAIIDQIINLNTSA